MEKRVTYEDFKDAWLADVEKDAGSSFQLGLRFAHKLVCDWLDVDPYSGDVIMTDGSGDGGIDVAILQRYGEIGDAEKEDVWYLVQSKYGSSFSGENTIIEEGRKLIKTLSENVPGLNQTAKDVIERIQNFVKHRGEKDKLVYVLATTDDILDAERKALDEIRILGKAKIGSFFEVETVSIATIYNRLEDLNIAPPKRSFMLKTSIPPLNDSLMVIRVGLLELFDFLKTYKETTNDLNLIYEKNVRKYLGLKKVAKGIRDTLINEPDRFGLYNNGITIVAENWEISENGLSLVEPYIVNGCQTTRTIYDVLSTILDSGGSKKNEDAVFRAWYEKLEKGFVVAKVVKISSGADGEDQLEKITRYTNSQNAVTDKDFISLSKDFQTLKSEMQKKYGVFLEIQRGDKAAQEARQKNNPRMSPYYSEFANAFELVKTYAAGWMSMPGPAFGKNPPFAPGGSVFKELTKDGSEFGVDDLYAAYRLMKFATENNFGKQNANGRGSTRFLFIFVVVQLFKHALHQSGIKTGPKEITVGLLKLFDNEELSSQFLNFCTNLIDMYMTQTDDEVDCSIFNEPKYREHGDLNAYLKSESLGKNQEYSPGLYHYIHMFKTQLSLTGLLPKMKALLAESGTVSVTKGKKA